MKPIHFQYQSEYQLRTLQTTRVSSNSFFNSPNSRTLDSIDLRNDEYSFS